MAIEKDRINSIVAAGGAAPGGCSFDLAGRLLLPAPVDGHLHLDKSFVGAPWRPHVPGDGIAARIEAERIERARVPLPMEERAVQLIDQVIGFGTVAIRSHVDIDQELGLSHVETLLELRDVMRDEIDLQLVAFPQSGFGGAVPDLMEEAMRLGVDVVGGLDPAGIDEDIQSHLDLVFGLAERFDRRVDIHLHDGGELGAFELRQIAERSKVLGMQGRVAVSHAFALGMIAPDVLQQTAEALAAGGIAIMTNGPGPDAMPPLHPLMDAGVLIFGGSDNIRDAWSPFGDGDLLRRASLIGYRANFRTDAELRSAFEFVTAHSRRVMGLEPVSIAAGSRADLIAVEAFDVPEAIADPRPARIVIRAGQIVRGVHHLHTKVHWSVA